MRFGRPASTWAVCKTALAAMPPGLAATLASTGTSFAKGATITADPFTDSCDDVSFHSTKDISDVVVHYADRGVVKDETVAGPDYSIDGGVGDEIDCVVVKSGTTRETFSCTRPNAPPTAILEIKTATIDDPTADDCTSAFSPPDLYCGVEEPRTIWTRWQPGAVWWFFPCGQSIFGFSFRGTSSSDPDNDIASWSIDFGDETSASGDWASSAPTEVTHAFDLADLPTTVTLTVTDSAEASDSDAMSTGVVPACND